MKLVLCIYTAYSTVHGLNSLNEEQSLALLNHCNEGVMEYLFIKFDHNWMALMTQSSRGSRGIVEVYRSVSWDHNAWRMDVQGQYPEFRTAWNVEVTMGGLLSYGLRISILSCRVMQEFWGKTHALSHTCSPTPLPHCTVEDVVSGRNC